MLSACFSLLTLIAPLSLGDADVRGDTRCPGPADVLDSIRPLLARDAALAPTGYLELRDVPSQKESAAHEQALEIRLRRTALEAPLGARRVERSRSCSETADAVAVIAATWIGEYRTAVPVPPPEAEASPPRESGQLAAPTIAHSQAGGGGGAVAFGLGAAGGLVAGATGTAAPALSLEVEMTLRRHWVLRVTGAGNGTRTLDVAEGRVAWERLLVSPSLARSWRSANASLDVGAGPVVAVTRAQGRGFASDGSDSAVSVGVAPAVRVGRRLGPLPVSLWLQVSALVWLPSVRAGVNGPGDGAEPAPRDLPWWDGMLTGGFTLFVGS